MKPGRKVEADGRPLCPDCGSDLAMEPARCIVDQILICPECGLELAVRTVSPLRLGAIPDDDLTQ